MADTMTNNELAQELTRIVNIFDRGGDLALALEKIDSLIIQLFIDDGSDLSKRLKEILFYD